MLHDAVSRGDTYQAFLPFKFTEGLFEGVSCAVSSLPMSAITWASTMTVDSILFALVLMKTRKKDETGLPSYLPDSSRCNLTSVIAKDSSVYFGMYSDLFFKFFRVEFLIRANFIQNSCLYLHPHDCLIHVRNRQP